MRAFHDSRNTAYRAPYGAVSPNEHVTLALDVWEATGATVSLRTWDVAKGERFVSMEPLPSADGIAAPPADCTQEFQRYQTTLTPDAPGIIWYQFVVELPDGTRMVYGARPECTGGPGELYPAESVSFQLSVHAPDAFPPAWHQPIEDYLSNGQAAAQPDETLETLRENFPPALFADAFPWVLENPGQHVALTAKAGGDSGANSAQADASRSFTADDAVFGTWQDGEDGRVYCALFNTSPDCPHDVAVPLVGESVSEIVNGYGVEICEASDLGGITAISPEAERYAVVQLGCRGIAILLFHPEQRLQQPLERGMGVLAHITSLPAKSTADAKNSVGESVHAQPDSADEPTGTLGEMARSFVDWASQAGMRYWQVLPVNPTDRYGSPYAGLSAFAGNVRLLAADDRDAAAIPETDEGFASFCEREADWLEPYAYFMALRQELGEATPWQRWPECYRAYDRDFLSTNQALRERAEDWMRQQYAFELQWSDLRSYANAHGVSIVGDMPIYVSSDSADTWANPQIFQLDEDGLPALVAGCPPDAFAEEGQTWGNPIYDWDTLEASGYRWWLRRLERAFHLYDYVRLDHFIGFSRYYSIPSGKRATEGMYRPGPGMRFFRTAREALGQLPIIAEDLGLITPGVRALSAACGFPGMDILQFVDGNDPLAGYQPRPDKIAYTGTHDNQTLLGYVLQRYGETDARENAQALLESVATCNASVAIIPLQDLMGLDDEARMNVPGTAKGNWAWQARSADMEPALETARKLVQLHQE